MAAPSVCLGEHVRRAKAKRDLAAALDVLEGNLSLFASGMVAAYRPIAVELRKLLCDREQSLLPRCFPGAMLHPHGSYRPGENLGGLVVQVPAQITFDGVGGIAEIVVFQRDRGPIPLDEWLNQPFLNESITLREFIRSVADREGAHADLEFNDTLRTALGVRLADHELAPWLIYGIGKYLLEYVEEAIRARPQIFGKE